MNTSRVGLIVLACALLISSVVASVSAQEHRGAAPGVVDLREIRLRVVGALFLAKLDAVNAKFEQGAPDKYHGLVLTVEVKKPAGTQLTLYAQDFSMHYYYGNDESDVAPCQGISGFSTTKDTDRPMTLKTSGRQASQTGTATSASETVYVDLFFDGFEPDTRELHLLLAQPCAAPFATRGWKD